MLAFDVVAPGIAGTDAGPVVDTHDDDGAAAVRFIESLRLAHIATSLGGPETLVTHPVSTTHHFLDADARRRTGLSAATVRMSVGLEHPDDLVADVLAALDRPAAG